MCSSICLENIQFVQYLKLQVDQLLFQIEYRERIGSKVNRFQKYFVFYLPFNFWFLWLWDESLRNSSLLWLYCLIEHFSLQRYEYVLDTVGMQTYVRYSFWELEFSAQVMTYIQINICGHIC